MRKNIGLIKDTQSANKSILSRSLKRNRRLRRIGSDTEDEAEPEPINRKTSSVKDDSEQFEGKRYCYIE